MDRPVIVTFDGSFDGFLCVVYAHYYHKVQPLIIQPADHAQLTLNEEVRHISTEPGQAARVLDGIRKKISDEAASHVYYAFLSYDDDKYMALFWYIKRGFAIGHMIDSHLTEDCVRKIHKMAQHAGREAHLLFGFCRFAETTSGVYYCEITPKNDVIAVVANHFSQRLMNQAWIIHDKKRGQAAVYNCESYVIATVPHDATFEYAPSEKETQDLWAAFFTTLAIESRKNPKLQRQLLPLYFRKNMTEFKQL